MSYNNEDEVREIIDLYRRRQLELERQQALYGARVDPSVPIEIENIRVEIDKLEERLIGGPYPPPPEPAKNLEIERPPYGTIDPESKFYIERKADDICLKYIGQPYAVAIFIQAPRQMGKSSLMHRTIYKAKKIYNKKCAFIDFEKIPQEYFDDEAKFFIEFCLMIGDALQIPDAIDKYWLKRRPNNFNCSRYLSEYIIPQVNELFILAIDEVDRLSNSSLQVDFFRMLNSWHSGGVNDENFSKITLFLSSSTEPHIFYSNFDLRLFKVAEVISLQDYTETELEKLNQSYHSILDKTQIKSLLVLTGGHPFLVRLAFYQLATGRFDLNTLLTQAAVDGGPFDSHLRYISPVLQEPELKQTLKQVCFHNTCQEDHHFHRLKNAGLIKKVGKKVVPRNELYARYFEHRLGD